MNTLLAFHGEAAVKEKYLARVRMHAAADQLVQGIGWEDGKGCAVGCTLENYDHSLYPAELGLPVWLARLEDSIFEGLPKADAMKWPAALLDAIPVGANVEPVQHKLAMRRLDRLIALQTKALEAKHGNGVHEAIEQTIAALHQVRRCHEAEANGNVCDVSTAARSAWSAARSAAESARSAAESAAESARSAAESARSAAESARSAAESAARSAWSESAAWSAWSESAAESARSESAAWKQEASDLLELLREAI